MIINQVKKNYIYNVTLSVVNILFPVISFPYAAHLLGPAGIGKSQFAVSFAQYFHLFAALGIPAYGIKEAAKYKHDPQKLSVVFSELTIIFILSSLLFSLVYCVIIFSFPYFENDRIIYLYALLIILLGFSYIDWLYTGLEEFKGITIRSVVIKLVSLALLFIFVTKEKDYQNYLLISVFSIVGNNLLSLFLARKKVTFILSGLNLKRHLKSLLYISGSNIAASIYMVWDTVLLGLLSTQKAVGLYTAAIKLTKITIPIVTAAGMVLLPKIARSMANQDMDEVDQLVYRSFDFTILLSVPVSIGLASLAPELIYIFSGSQFFTASRSMQIAAALPVLLGLGHLFSFQILLPANRNKQVFLSALGGVLASLLLNMLLTSKLRDVGAAMANVAAEAVVTALYLCFVKKYFSFKFKWELLFNAILCSLLFVPVISAIRLTTGNAFAIVSIAVPVSTALYLLAQWLLFKNILVKNSLYFIYKKVSFNKYHEQEK
jgi:O-antigen/teichoic acid export membrane protein